MSVVGNADFLAPPPGLPLPIKAAREFLKSSLFPPSYFFSSTFKSFLGSSFFSASTFFGGNDGRVFSSFFGSIIVGSYFYGGKLGSFLSSYFGGNDGSYLFSA
jgi:hypothetical protein